MEKMASMTRDVLISIKGLYSLGGSGEDDIVVTVPGKATKINDTWLLKYEEPVEGMQDRIQSMIKLRRGGAEVVKRGVVRTNMIFEPGKRHETFYETSAGSIRLGILATKVSMTEESSSIHAEIDYAVEVNCQHMTDCHILVDVRPGLKNMSRLPVGVFDSGVGGISVLRAMVSLLPGEDFLYFGDSANAPYGTKDTEEIRRLTLLHAAELYRQGIKALVIACNTATSAAIRDLREIYRDIPVIGIEPALKPAVLSGTHPTVVVMATPQTVEGNKFHRLVERFAGDAEIIPLSCPGLMEYVERGELEGENVEKTLHTLLDPLLERHVDAVVLGCTHYPFLISRIRSMIGDEVLLLDGSEGTARELRRRLAAEHLLREDAHAGCVTFRMSLPDRVPLCEKLLNASRSE